MGWKRTLTVSIYYHYCMKKKQAGGLFWMQVVQHQQWRKCKEGEGVGNLPSWSMWGLPLKLR